MKYKKGTTLIEIIIYIALFSILISGAFISAFQLIDSNNKINSNISLEEEGNFVLRKINWALTGLDPTNPPTVTGSGCLQTLTLIKTNYLLNPIVLRLNLDKLEVSEGAGIFIPITTTNVSVQCFEAKIIPAIGTSPMGVSATTTINGSTFSITKYTIQ